MDFTLLLNFCIALIPGLFWLAVLALRHTQDPEFRRLVFKTFFLGMAICTPAGFINSSLTGFFEVKNSVFAQFLMYVFVVGPNEEGLKFLIVWSEGYRRWRFRSEMDGIVLASASALGFATYENAVYMQQFGIKVLLLRAWACALGHLCFSAIFGFYLGLAKAKRYAAGPIIGEGLALAAFFHGMYDLAVTIDGRLMYVVVPCLLAYYTALTHGRFRPILSVIAPRWVAYEAPQQKASTSFQKRRFPTATRADAVMRVTEVIDQLGSLDEDQRRAGLEAARSLVDQRIFEAVAALTHDPVESVRTAAEGVHKEMRRQLRG